VEQPYYVEAPAAYEAPAYTTPDSAARSILQVKRVHFAVLDAYILLYFLVNKL